MKRGKIYIFQFVFLLILFSCNNKTEIYRTVLFSNYFKNGNLIDSIVFVYNYFEEKDNYRKIHVNRTSYTYQIEGSEKKSHKETLTYYILLKNDSVYTGIDFEGNDTVYFYPYLPQKINETYFFNLFPHEPYLKTYMTLIEDNKAESTKIYKGNDHFIHTIGDDAFLWTFDNKLRLLRMSNDDKTPYFECKRIEKLKKLPSDCYKPNKKMIAVLKAPMSMDEQYNDIKQYYQRWIESLPPDWGEKRLDDLLKSK